MSGNLDTLVAWGPYAALVALAVALLLVFVRLLIGPHLADRIVALDTMTYLSIGFCAVWALATGQDAFLDAAATLALISFLATAALARRIVRRRDPEARP